MSLLGGLWRRWRRWWWWKSLNTSPLHGGVVKPSPCARKTHGRRQRRRRLPRAVTCPRARRQPHARCAAWAGPRSPPAPLLFGLLPLAPFLIIDLRSLGLALDVLETLLPRVFYECVCVLCVLCEGQRNRFVCVVVGLTFEETSGEKKRFN